MTTIQAAQQLLRPFNFVNGPVPQVSLSPGWTEDNVKKYFHDVLKSTVIDAYQRGQDSFYDIDFRV